MRRYLPHLAVCGFLFGRLVRDTRRQKEEILNQDSNILNSLDFEPEDTRPFELAQLLESNRALVESAQAEDIGRLYILAGLDALKTAICGTDSMTDARIALEIQHEMAFGSALQVIQMMQSNDNPHDDRADE